MLSLILFRHAKSDWNAEYASDPERPLAQRGIRAARFMGQFLAATGQVPALALTSHAVRAKDTLDLARRQGDWRCRVEVDPDIYGSDADRLLDRNGDEIREDLPGSVNANGFATGFWWVSDFKILGANYGTHPAVRIYYSPEVHRWLGYRRGRTPRPRVARRLAELPRVSRAMSRGEV